MNLEVIMEWVDFFFLKKEKNKFEIVCIWLRIFMNYSPLFPHHIFYLVHLCVVQNKSPWEGAERGRRQLQGCVSIKCLGRQWSCASGSPALRLVCCGLRVTSPATQKFFGERVLNANTEGINILLLLWFLLHPPRSHQSRKFNSNGFMTWVQSAERDN